MSIFISRPKVNTVAVAQVPSQVVRAAKLIATMLPALDAATRAALSEIDQANLPVPALRPRLEFPERVSLPNTLAPIEALKAAALAEIAAAPCYIENTHAF